MCSAPPTPLAASHNLNLSPRIILSHIKTRLSREYTCVPNNRYSTVRNTFNVPAGDMRQHFCNPSFLQLTFSQTLSSYRPNAKTGSVRLFFSPWVGRILLRKIKVGSAKIREWHRRWEWHRVGKGEVPQRRIGTYEHKIPERRKICTWEQAGKFHQLTPLPLLPHILTFPILREKFRLYSKPPRKWPKCHPYFKAISQLFWLLCLWILCTS